MLPLRHKHWRYLFQALWLLIFAVLASTGATLQVWSGLLAGGLLSALFLKRAACAFVCPAFPPGELLWRAGVRLWERTFTPPFWFDVVLRAAKYLVLGWLVLAWYDRTLLDMHAGAQHAASLLIAAILVLSLFFQLPWCRYLCPYGALLGLLSLTSLLKVRRSPRHCVRCHKCSNHCPAHLPVMLRTTVRSAECLACYHCVDGCPAPGALAFATPGNRAVPAWLAGSLLTLLLLTVSGLSLLM